MVVWICGVMTSPALMLQLVVTPRRVCASGVKQSVVSVVVCRRLSYKKKLKTGDLEAKTISKQENKDEIRRILACVYLREHKAVLFSAFSTFI